MPGELPVTRSVHHEAARFEDLPAWRAEVIDGPDRGLSAGSEEARLTLGRSARSSLPLTDPEVSSHHVECEATPEGLWIRDLKSRNGTWFARARVREVCVTAPSEIVLGRATRVRLTPSQASERVLLSPDDRYGALLGRSPVMRRVFDRLERVARADSPVLLLGESGTGKELAARAIHEHGPRAERPYEVVNCGGLSLTLAESELFGHARGAFTDAKRDHEGAFERAGGGTLFLDELGEMPLEIQAKLLQVLETGRYRRLGGVDELRADVRVIAATNRDLRREVNEGRFREDLYYRIAVVQVRLPPLRDHLDDLDLIAPALVERIRAARQITAERSVDDALLKQLKLHTWPGNVRELRNQLENLLVFDELPPIEDEASCVDDLHDALAMASTLPWAQAKAQWIERFEREYLRRVLRETDHNVAEASRRAGVDRATFFRALRRLGLAPT